MNDKVKEWLSGVFGLVLMGGLGVAGFSIEEHTEVAAGVGERVVAQAAGSVRGLLEPLSEGSGSRVNVRVEGKECVCECEAEKREKGEGWLDKILRYVPFIGLLGL